jgi:hypothetical protein
MMRTVRFPKAIVVQSETFGLSEVDADPLVRPASGGRAVIGAPARQVPGDDLVPFGASSTQRDEVVPVFETLAASDTGHASRHGPPLADCHRPDRHRAIEP